VTALLHPELVEAAAAYVHRGWPVFPCEPEGKRPAGRLVPRGLLQATLDEDQVWSWWKREPNANIGLRTGVAFDVLDIDGSEGMIAINEAAPWFGEPWDGGPTDNDTIDGPTVITGRGHHVYVAVTDHGNKTGLIPHIDWRGKGGYVVAPPSIHANGNRYSWFPGWGPDEQEIRPVPAWLLELLTKPVAFDPPAIERGARAPSSDAYGRRALESEAGRVVMAPEGQRNDQLNRSAHALGQLVGAGVLDVDDVINALLVAASRVGLSESEARATIASGLRAGLASPRRVAS
jgi:hypothetical protein